MKIDLTEWDKLKYATISTSIRRARALLMSISLVAAWLLAGQIADLVKWENIRKPASINLVYQASINKLTSLKIRVRPKSLRTCDEWTYLKEIDRSDSILISFPSSGSFRNILSWCQHYYEYILDQALPDQINATNIILDRGDISKTVLPQHFIKRPEMEVPVIGLNVAFDDINIVGAVILLFLMLWFRFSLQQLKENIIEIRGSFPPHSFQKRYFNFWLPMQFVFIPPNESAPKPLAYCLFFTPFMVVLFALLVSIHDMIWQAVAYSYIVGGSLGPFSGKLPTLLEQTTGLVLIRWFILVTAATILFKEAMKSWRIMMHISEKSDINQVSDSHKSQIKWRSLLLALVLSPICIMTVWTGARLIEYDYVILIYGWIYNLGLLGSIIVAVSILASIMIGKSVVRRIYS